MQRETRWLGMAVMACLAGASVPTAALAQESILLRYHPQIGSRYQTLWWTDISAIVGEGAEGAESVTLEAAMLESVTYHVMASRALDYVVNVRADSTRARMRAVGTAWRILDFRVDPYWADLVIDAQLRVGETMVEDPDIAPTELRRIRGFAGGMEFAFPDEPVTAGATWSRDIVFPLGSVKTLEDETGFSGDAELVARSIFSLDSVVPRGVDTLAYMQVRGNFLPTTVPAAAEDTELSVSIAGQFAGRLIWSTGWDAYVSGAARLVLDADIQEGTGDVAITTTTVQMEIIRRFQIRP